MHAAAFLADPPGEGVGEFDLGGRVRPVAELVLEPLQTQSVERAVGAKSRHEKTGEPARGLREDKEGIAHRSREKPFMAGDLIFVFRHALRARGVRANIAAALLLRHAHSHSRALLLPEGPEGSVVDARGDERHQLHEVLGRGRERGNAGVSHGHGTEMAGLDPAREVVQGRARDMPFAAEPSARRSDCRRGSFEGRGRKPRPDAVAHQRVIGRMELDEVLALAACVKSPELGRVLIGETRKLEMRGRAERCRV